MMADVTLKYKGATIGELSDTGNKTIETAGKYCDADILLEYVKSGGALPSSISKIDGGTFSVNSDTKCSSVDIPTTLGVPAKKFVIWTDDLPSFEALSNRALLFVSVNLGNFESASGTTRYGSCFYMHRQTAGGTYQGNTTLNYSNLPESYSNSTKINYYVGDTYYTANKTYKWLAWA